MRKFFIQLSSDSTKFENVDQHVFDNRKFAVDGDKPRYTDNWFSCVCNSVEIHIQDAPMSLIGGICRMLGQTPGGVGKFDEPTHVNFHRGRSHWLYEVATGEKWKKAA